ncbi:MAG: type II toxin-antitoxin system PemK/MazF family toxin [Oscillospiraceae bacterium]|nr:type II toxin-antitoxin system PemK/MazF family toxin [Oscillospiraceae bacterium]
MLRRGDIYFADLGNTVGSEQGGIRPVLIVQNDIGNYYSPTSIVLPITSAWKKPLPTHAELVPECGLRKHSTALAEQIRTIDRSRILRYAGYLYPEEMQPINRAILTALGVNNSETIRTG